MIHLIDQTTCERTPLVATLVGDVCRAVRDAGGQAQSLVLGRDEAAKAAGLEADGVIACPRDAVVPGGIGAMKQWLKGTRPRPKTAMAGLGADAPWVCWSKRCELLMSLVRPQTLRIMPGEAHQACTAERLHDAMDRQTLRQQWGVDDEQCVALLLCDDPAAMNADLAALAVGLAAETGRPWRLVMHPATKNAAQAQKMARQMGDPHCIITDDRATVTWRVIGACDAALWLPSAMPISMRVGDPSAGLSLAWAMLSGAVIVGEPHPWLAHEQTAWVGQTGRARTIASGLCRVHDDPAAAKAMGVRAADCAQVKFDPARAATWWRRLGTEGVEPGASGDAP